MPKKADPLPINVENWNNNFLKTARKRALLSTFEKLYLLGEGAADDLPDFTNAMLCLEILFAHKDDARFTADGWWRYLQRFNGDVVTIPADWVRPLLAAWSLYCDPNDPVPLERAAGLDGEGGGRKASSKINELIEHLHLARAIFEVKQEGLSKGVDVSDKAAFIEVEARYFELGLGSGLITSS